MDMIDMKRSAPDEKSEECCMPCPRDKEDYYPYGLNIRLEGEDLAKLGVSQLPACMSEVRGSFVAVVTATSKEAGEEAEACMSLQITGLALDAIKAAPAPAVISDEKPAKYTKPHIVE